MLAGSAGAGWLPGSPVSEVLAELEQTKQARSRLQMPVECVEAAAFLLLWLTSELPLYWAGGDPRAVHVALHLWWDDLVSMLLPLLLLS